ncbi:hypothetical protein GOB94_15370 [Granulicella sp. 5B5]|nr:hypothetical protein [Granulicella sp. 5B5]QMV19906.1 hypothetical protein GOB94_15370 [Granulicella sp. 5B5]
MQDTVVLKMMEFAQGNIDCLPVGGTSKTNTKLNMLKRNAAQPKFKKR